jgi:hypothetical protein
MRMRQWCMVYPTCRPSQGVGWDLLVLADVSSEFWPDVSRLGLLRRLLL